MIINEIRADNPGQFRFEGPLLQLQVVKGFINALEGEQGRHGGSGCEGWQAKKSADNSLYKVVADYMLFFVKGGEFLHCFFLKQGSF